MNSTQPSQSSTAEGGMPGPVAAPANRTVLVLGANGRFGAAAVRAFAGAGWQVLAQARRAPSTPLPAGTRHLAASLDDPARLAAEAAGATVVVYGVNPVYTDWDTQALALLRQGLALTQRLGARLLFPGNVYNYGASMPARLDEDNREQPTTRKGRIRCAMEAELRAAARNGTQCTVIRAGDFFGSGSGSWLDLVIAKSIAQGRIVYPGPLDQVHAWAYLPDLAQAFVAAAQVTTLAPFEQLNFAGHALTGRELVAALERAAGALGITPARGWRTGAMPWWLIRIGGLVVPMWRELAEMAYLWDVPHQLDGSRMKRLLGPLPSTGLDAAMVATLRALGHGGSAQHASMQAA